MLRIRSIETRDILIDRMYVLADGASKAALNHLTILLATTLANKFITVNTICPG